MRLKTIFIVLNSYLLISLCSASSFSFFQDFFTKKPINNFLSQGPEDADVNLTFEEIVTRKG